MDPKNNRHVSFYKKGNRTFNSSREKNDSYASTTHVRVNGFGESLKLPTSRSLLDGDESFSHFKEPLWKRVFDPSSDGILKWNRIFLLACLVALFFDPLLFYLPQVDDKSHNTSCMTRDLTLGGVVTFFRSVTDIFYFLNIFVRFRTAFVAPSSRVFGKGELVLDKRQIAWRYIRSGFVFDLLAALPLPQILIWFIIPAIHKSRTKRTFSTLQLIVLVQYILRLYLNFKLSSEITRAAGVVTSTAWAGAAYNLLLYMLASHVLGAAWYLMSVERFSSCWKSKCKQEDFPIECQLQYLDCSTVTHDDRMLWAHSTKVFSLCDPNDKNVSFDYGIFENAMLKRVVSDAFTEKFFYCLWWGLQQLSSYGQNLHTSTYVWETSCCIIISMVGLVLFAHLIGNMQTYLESITSRLEEWRLKRRDTEEWMRHRQLPEHLRGRVRRFVQYQWLATRGVNEEAILTSLPTDLRRDIQRHLCLNLVRRVPLFAKMDDQLLDAICERLKSSLSTTGTYIVREGDPVSEMLLIIRGKLESSTTNGGRSGFFNSITLREGDFCGEELLGWALLPNATANLPSSSRTVRAIEEVEAFSLQAEDLKFVANQFHRLHSKKLQYTFRYYSHHWRAWAACLIEAAWRRYNRRKSMARLMSLTESSFGSYSSENVGYDQEDHEEGGSSSRGERFARNTRSSQRSSEAELPKLFKPQDPDFSHQSPDF